METKTSAGGSSDPRLGGCSICIETLFLELSLPDRIRRIAESGFSAIEFWGWRDKDLPEIERALAETGVKVAAFSGSRRGSIGEAAASRTLLEDLREGIETARRLGCTTLILLADELSPDGSVAPSPNRPDPSLSAWRDTAVRTLKLAAGRAAESGITLVLEPLNTLVDHPGYSVSSSTLGFELVREVGSPWLKLLYDVYHMQIMEGNLISTLTQHIDLLGHIHVADVPGRHEPGSGEINYVNVLRTLAHGGYKGFVGFECFPRTTSQAALEAIKEVCLAAWLPRR